eukprot:12749274-Ditylum_brightwellii.AAC.1
MEGASSDKPCVGNYKPEGIAIMAGGNIVGRICALGTDKRGLGQWAYMCLNDQYDKNIWIIGAYRLGNNKSSGDKTTYQQQRRLLLQQ